MMQLFDYQTKAVNFMLKRKKGCLFLDCGLGKTLISLTWLYLKRKEIRKVLIIAPLRVAEHTWTDEIEKWGIPFSVSKVLGPEKKRIAALNKMADIYIINPENIKWLIDNKYWDFDCLIVDELSNFKSYNSSRFKALKKVKYAYFWGLTGTPAPNSLMQLWPEIYLVDAGRRLGANITKFRAKYCDTVRVDWGVDYTLRKGADEIIHGKVKDCCLSMAAVNPPPVVFNDIVVSMDTKEAKKYNAFKAEYVFNDDIVVGSAAVMANKLRQLANGFIYDEEKTILKFHDKKLDAMEDIIEDCHGAPVLVFYDYMADLLAITERFPEAQNLNIREWNKGNISLMLAHPKSCGHGLNLQDGGHIIIWYGLPWDLESYIQANARLARTGQKETVIIHQIITKNTIDIEIKNALKYKKINQSALLQAVRNVK